MSHLFGWWHAKIGRKAGIGAPLVILACAIICVGLPGHSLRAAQAQSAEHNKSWQEDLHYFATHFPELQDDFEKLYQKDKFDSELAEIRESIPNTSGTEIVLALTKLVASAHSTHTRVWLPTQIQYNRLPITFYWYSDGLGVSSATEEFRQLLGARVVRIGTMTPEQIEAAAAPYISYENQYWLHSESVSWMVETEFLRQLKLTGADGNTEVSVIKPDGEPLTVQLPTLGPIQLRDAHFITVEDGFGHPVPTINKARSSYYWYEYLPESKALYIQFNVCENDPKQPFGEFTSEVFEFAKEHPVERTIVDLRFNPGGSTFVIRPLRTGLESRPALSARGHLYVLVGRFTASAAVDATKDFRDKLHAIVVGEPLGEKPNAYGEMRMMTLPNSKIKVSYSTEFYTLVKGSDPDSYYPEIPVNRSIADAVAGRDPALETALHHPAQ